MRKLVALLVVLASLLRPALATAADTVPPTCKIIDTVISGSTGSGSANTYFTYYIKATDETKLLTPRPLEYRARVNGTGFGPWRPFNNGTDGPLTIPVQCTAFEFQVRAVDAAGNRSAAITRSYAAPFPITPVGGGAVTKFSAPQNVPGGGTTVKRVLAKFDFDGDGTNDIVEADSHTGVKVRRNTEGDGKTFTDVDLPFIPDTLNSVAAGKLVNKAGGTTNDALPDLAVAANGSITLEANQGVTGGALSFTALDPVLFVQDQFIDGVAVADLNHDGFDDIVATTQTGQVAVFLNLNGTTGGFAAPVLVNSALAFFYDIQIADLNKDTYPDVAVTGYNNSGQPGYEIFVNDGAGKLTSKESDALTDYPTSFALADVTGDGVPDLVAAVSGTFFIQGSSTRVNPKVSVELLRNQGDGTFKFLDLYPLYDQVITAHARIFHASVAVADTNFDGHPEIVAACELSNVGKLYQPKAILDPDDGSLFAFSLARSSSLIFGAPVRALAFGDLDGNGKPDIFTANTTEAKPASVLLNLTAGVTVPTSFKFSVTDDTKPLDGFISGWDFNFSTVLAASAAGLKLRVQSTLTPDNEGSWTDLPGGGYLTKSGVNNWKLLATDIPLGLRYFRVIASSDDFGDKITKSVGPINITVPVYSLDVRAAEVTDTTPKVTTTGFKHSYTLKVERGSTGLMAVQVTNLGSRDRFVLQVPRNAMGEHFRTLAADNVDLAPYVMPAAPADSFVTLTSPYVHHNGTYTFYLKGRVGGATPEGEIGSFTISGKANADPNKTATAEIDFKAINPKNTFFVTNTNDFGAGSFRQAVFDLIAHPAKAGRPVPDIKFEIPTSDAHYNSGSPLISLQSSVLPILYNGVVIDGNTQVLSQRFSGLAEGAVILQGDSSTAQVNHTTPKVSVGLDILGGSCRVERLIFADMETGVRLSGAAANGNVIRGCGFLANAEAGVLIESGANRNIVGGSETSDRNFFMGIQALVTFGRFGVEIRGDNSDQNKVQGNLIGAGLSSLGGNTGMGDAGVCITGGAQGNLIGGTSASLRNVIVYNGLATNIEGLEFGGVSISGDHTDANLVQGNYIGVDETGKVAAGNELGVQIEYGAKNNLIGGTDAGAGNVISGNNYNGVSITGSTSHPTSGNRVVGNIIGLDALGDQALANGDRGVNIDNAHDNFIGGATDAARNIISSNANDGVEIAAHRTLVQGNYIGTDFTGQFARPNGKSGVFILCGNDNVIGFNTKSAGGNIIAFNTGRGVELDAAILSGESALSGYRNTIRGNSILGNGKLGIDLHGPHENSDGENLNGLGVAADANEGLNHPSIQVAAVTTDAHGTKTTNVIIHFNDVANTNYAFDFYASDLADPSGFGEGQTSLGYLERKTDGTGMVTFTGQIKGDYSGKVIAATATKKAGADFGSTSEFSEAITVTTQLTLTQDGDTTKYVTFNAATGDYEFHTNISTVISGRGTISRSGNIVTLTDNRNDRKIKAQADIGANTGTATYQALPGTAVISISDTVSP